MNKEKVLGVAFAIEHHTIKTLGFNMGCYFQEGSDDDEEPEFHDQTGHLCGTTACIAGWAIALEDGVDRLHMMSRNSANTFDRAQSILGLTYDQAEQLFLRRDHADSQDDLDRTTDDQAIATLKRLAETGEVSW